MRSYAYHLEQDNHLQGTSRDQDEAWTEWTPTTGTRFRFDDIDLRSTTPVATGTGFPRVDAPVFLETAPASPDFIVAPGDALTLRNTKVVTHQVRIRVPVR